MSPTARNICSFTSSRVVTSPKAIRSSFGLTVARDVRVPPVCSWNWGLVKLPWTAIARPSTSTPGMRGRISYFSINRTRPCGSSIVRIVGPTLFFVLISVGVGYSYSDYGVQVETTEDAAPAVQQFVSLFFETFSEFKGRPFHLMGESYAVTSYSYSAAVLPRLSPSIQLTVHNISLRFTGPLHPCICVCHTRS